jgi:hypothetical protein
MNKKLIITIVLAATTLLCSICSIPLALYINYELNKSYQSERIIIQSPDLSCSEGLKLFDTYSEQIGTPKTEDKNSLCFGITSGSNFSKIEPKWAIAKAIRLAPYYNSMPAFTGDKSMRTIGNSVSMDQNLEDNAYYKIDMINFCRELLIESDKNATSKISKTLTPLEKVDCDI